MDQPRDARYEVPASAASATSAEAVVAASRDEPRRHDQTYKLLFSHPVAARSLVRDVLARDWSDELDMKTLERFPTEHVDARLRRSLGDMAYRVWFKGGARSAVFLVEFQSSADENMALRMMEYATVALAFLHADPKRLDADRLLPLLVAHEVYTGPGRSTAKRNVRELFELPKVPPAAKGKIGSLPSHDYAGVDLRWMQGEGLVARDTVAEWVGALEREPLESLPRVHASMAVQMEGSAHLEFRHALAKWTDERMRALGVTRREREQIEERIVNPKERPEMAQTWQEWLDVKGAQAQTQLLVRLASRRFGTETGQRLAELVEPMGAEELVRVGDAVVDCRTGDELLERVSNGTGAEARQLHPTDAPPP